MVYICIRFLVQLISTARNTSFHQVNTSYIACQLTPKSDAYPINREDDSVHMETFHKAAGTGLLLELIAELPGTAFAWKADFLDEPWKCVRDKEESPKLSLDIPTNSLTLIVFLQCTA